MATTGVTPVGMWAQSTGQVTTEANGKLGKQDFLAMLIAQMKYQDPLNPLDNSQMIAQMASFSQLEQSLAMTEGLTQLQAVSMLGKMVTAMGTDGTPFAGIVRHVSANGDMPILTLAAPDPADVPSGVTVAPDGSIVALKDVQDVSY